MKDSSAGLLAAIFMGIAPGYISRSVAGSYDNEAIAITLNGNILFLDQINENGFSFLCHIDSIILFLYG